jgi:hypothetical protein
VVDRRAMTLHQENVVRPEHTHSATENSSIGVARTWYKLYPLYRHMMKI